jgi:hypothetical protein
MSPPTRSLAGGASPMTRSIGREKKWMGCQGDLAWRGGDMSNSCEGGGSGTQGCAWE